MEAQMTSSPEGKSLGTKLKEFMENTKENIDSKSRQINTLIQSMKTENDLLISKCN